MSVMKCPHCGREYSPQACKPLIPTHDWPPPCRAVCPGSGQIPRNAETDRRPLWKDDPELKQEKGNG
jgi:hypothetical protein